jgi:hypothetical protein
MVELFEVMIEKVDDVLTSQLYAMIPLGSVTADQEMVSGALRVAPEAGESRLGAGGVAAFAMCGIKRKKQKVAIKPKVGERCFFIGFSVFLSRRRIIGTDKHDQPGPSNSWRIQ